MPPTTRASIAAPSDPWNVNRTGTSSVLFGAQALNSAVTEFIAATTDCRFGVSGMLGSFVAPLVSTTRPITRSSARMTP